MLCVITVPYYDARPVGRLLHAMSLCSGDLINDGFVCEILRVSGDCNLAALPHIKCSATCEILHHVSWKCSILSMPTLKCPLCI